MFNQIRCDFDSNGWLAVVVAAFLVLGAACWLPALSARRGAERLPPTQSAIAVLTDPFDGQKK